MRKFRLIILLLMCVFVFYSCSGNSLPISRKQNPQDDEIKFYGFEWLSELETIKKKFNNDFGSDSYSITEGKEEISLGNKLSVYEFDISIKENNALSWKIAGNEVEKINLKCLSNDNKKHSYLYSASYYFANPSEEKAIELISKLNELYSVSGTVNISGWFQQNYNDKNNNTVTIYYYTHDTTILSIQYTCNEIQDMINERKIETEENNTTNKTGL